jgi:hypothetical protein
MEDLISSTGFEFMYNLLVIFFLLLHANGTCLLTSYPFQCTKVANIHDDLWQLSYGSVTVRSYGRYDVNGFCFRLAPFEAARRRAATINSGVVTRAINEQGQEINYYGIIQQILEFSFVGTKN